MQILVHYLYILRQPQCHSLFTLFACQKSLSSDQFWVLTNSTFFYVMYILCIMYIYTHQVKYFCDIMYMRILNFDTGYHLVVILNSEISVAHSYSEMEVSVTDTGWVSLGTWHWKTFENQTSLAEVMTENQGVIFLTHRMTESNFIATLKTAKAILMYIIWHVIKHCTNVLCLEDPQGMHQTHQWSF